MFINVGNVLKFEISLHWQIFICLQILDRNDLISSWSNLMLLMLKFYAKKIVKIDWLFAKYCEWSWQIFPVCLAHPIRHTLWIFLQCECVFEQWGHLDLILYITADSRCRPMLKDQVLLCNHHVGAQWVERKRNIRGHFQCLIVTRWGTYRSVWSSAETWDADTLLWLVVSFT